MKKYEYPECDIIWLDNADIITTSPEQGETPEDPNEL